MGYKSMKEKIKKIKPKTVLTITAITIAIFSIFMLARIIRLNSLIYNECEPREYVEWTKEIKIPLTPDRIKEIEKEITEGKKFLNSPNPFLTGIAEYDLETNKEILRQGYETKIVSDEERRAKSEREVEDYKNCLKKQKLAIKQRPETYRLLFIGNALIIIIGLLIAFAIKESKKY
jgi:hypothetical protein